MLSLRKYQNAEPRTRLSMGDHGILTVHFAGMPPGTAALLIKFLPAAVIAAIGGAETFTAAVDASLDAAAAVVTDGEAVRRLIVGAES